MPAFLFDWPTVSANNTYATVTNRAGATRRIVSAKAQAWRDGVILTVRQSGQPCPAGDLQIALYGWPSDNRRRDVDNISKPLQDSIALAWGIDDKRFKRVAATLGAASVQPYLEVYVWPFSETDRQRETEYRQKLRRELGPVAVPSWWTETTTRATTSGKPAPGGETDVGGPG